MDYKTSDEEYQHHREVAIHCLKEDLRLIQERVCPHFRVVDHRDIFHWTVIVKGPEEGAHSNYWFKIALLFPNNYPSYGPMIRMDVDCFHPNLNPHLKFFWVEQIHWTGWCSQYGAVDAIEFFREGLETPSEHLVVNEEAALMFGDTMNYEKAVWMKIEEERAKRNFCRSRSVSL